MQITHHAAILVVVFLMNLGINAFFNKERKEKSGDDVSVANTAVQSLVSTIFAVLILFLLFTYVLKTATTEST